MKESSQKYYIGLHLNKKNSL